MPLPTPHADESRTDFVTRCLADSATQEMQGTDEQKVAACEAQYDDAKKSAKLSEAYGMKAVPAVILGDESKGEVVAHFATMDEVDNDGEVFPFGAIPDGMKMTVSSYNHDTVMNQLLGTPLPDQPPVGKGVVRLDGKKAIAHLAYFMETTRGREAYLTIKAMGADQAWSFAYHKEQVDRPNAEWAAKGAQRMLTKVGPLLDGAMEVSPVKMPGGKRTGTLAVKQADAVPPILEPVSIPRDPVLEARIARALKLVR